MIERFAPLAVVVLEAGAGSAQPVQRNRGVRMLPCVDVAAPIEGVVTLADVVGERPIRVAQARGIPNAELLVRDIMTPQARLEALRFDEVARARGGRVVESLRRAARQHALVADSRPPQRERGVFRVTRIARPLGVVPKETEVAHTLAESEAALAH